MLAANRSEIFSQVADLIEQNPERYDFATIVTPEPGAKACIWGLAGEIMGAEPGTRLTAVAEALGMTESGLYSQLTHVNFHVVEKSVLPLELRKVWTHSPEAAVRCLRKLVDMGVAA